MLGLRSRLLPAMLLALALVLSGVGCVKTAQVGSHFTVEVPGGWYSEVDKDDPDTLVLGPKDAQWVWAFYATPLDERAEGESLEQFGERLVEDDAEETAHEEEHDSVELTWSEASELDINGLEGVTVEGEMVDSEDPDFVMGLKLVVLVSSESLLVGFGMRFPHAGDEHDAEVDTMLRSVLQSGG